MTVGEQASRVAVVIASVGRPTLLAQVLPLLRGQTLPPSRIILSVASSADLPASADVLAGIDVVIGAKGLTLQRNAALRHLAGDCDVVAFFDDDYVPSRSCVERIARFMIEHPDVVGADGHLLADGINSPGINLEQAVAIVRDYDANAQPESRIFADVEGLYGCNMAYRADALADCWFDERLRLYGWQEDIDFAARLLPKGRLVKTTAFAGVHMGNKGGRTSGVRLGYSQLVNPVYLVRKGTMKATFAARLMVQNFIANHMRSFRPEPWIDRRGRVVGNWMAIADLLRGTIEPEKIERM